MKRLNILQSLLVLFVFSLIAWGLVPNAALGAVPQLINFQGVLKDGSGNPVPDASYSVTFTIYDAPIGGNVKWTETQSVTTTGGLFTVLLGSTTPLPDSVFYDSSRYLGMAVSPDPEMIPRQRLSSVGYSSVSSQWTSAGENLFRLNGKVGIGEPNPLNTLTIGSNGGWTSTGLFPGILMGTTSGQIRQFLIGRDEGNFVQLAYDDDFGFASARLLAQGNHPLSIASDGPLFISTDDSLYIRTGGITRVFVSNAGDVGIGTESPSKKLEVVGSIKTSDTLFASNVSSNSPLQLQAPAGATRMFINDANGNVGIGTTSPSARLSIVKNDNLDDDILKLFPQNLTQGIGFSLNKIRAIGSNGNTFLFIDAQGTGNLLLQTNSTGNVGIGTTAPNMKLHVVGGSQIDGDVDIRSTGKLILRNPGYAELYSSNMKIAGGSTFTFDHLGIASANWVFNDANVGIGTTSPTEKLHVVGNICATGTIGACSDVRFKRDVQPMEGSLDKIEKLQGVAYRWNRKKYPQFAEGKQIGFVAQEVKEVLPEIVSEGSDGTLSVDYGRFSVVLLEAIKEQQKEINELKAAIEKLQVQKR
jgi:hypothetical protein